MAKRIPNDIELSHNSLRVLIVDDNTDAAYMMGMLVEVSGHHAYIEYHPLKALERAKVVRPDVCLLNIGLPEIEGIELTRQLRLLPELRYVKLIAVSGYGQASDKQASQTGEFDEHLVKPVHLHQLQAIFEAINKNKG